MPVSIEGQGDAGKSPAPEDVVSLVSKRSGHALVIEDNNNITPLLNSTLIVDRISHNELMTQSGDAYRAKVLSGMYSLVWICSPDDWYARTAGKRTTPHWNRILQWCKFVKDSGHNFVLSGPQGFFWKLPPIIDFLKERHIEPRRIRLCQLGLKFSASGPPSGSYFNIATTIPININYSRCKCNVAIKDHCLDWYGNSYEKGAWRRTVT